MVSKETYPGQYFSKITASSNALDPRPRSIYIAVSGSMDIKNSDGSSETAIQVVAGSVIPCQFYKITAISGATIYGIYG